jgi:hypothetical protein
MKKETKLSIRVLKPGMDRFVNKYKYAYEFDTKHNWVKRTTSKWVAKDGKSDYEPAYVDYRTITYHE